ncbi:MAG: ABC transporter permease, partial [Alphaproteobacteria bacterium]
MSKALALWWNYAAVAIRALGRHRVYAFVNLAGLALGLAACLIILLYVRYERSYDSWLPDADRVFQIQANWHEVGQPVSRSQASPFPVHDRLA